MPIILRSTYLVLKVIVSIKLFSLQVLVVNAQGDITRVSTRNGKDVVMKGTISQYFKLGQEGKYRVYINQYTTNTVALNKHQHREASSTCFHV